jgi:hypothetical protein
MGNVPSTMMIATTEARHACRGEPDLFERIRKAMNATRDHWMERDEDNQFRSAVAAAMMESPGPDRERLERSTRSLARLSAVVVALTSGVPVDVEKMSLEPEPDLIPLVRLWRRTDEPCPTCGGKGKVFTDGDEPFVEPGMWRDCPRCVSGSAG